MCHEEWKQRTARELQYFRGGVSRHAIWRTATYLSPWSLVVHITSDRQVWIPPQPGHTKLPDDAARVAFAQYSLGSLVALQLMMRHARSVPDVTAVLFFNPNCIYTLSDSALLFNYHAATQGFVPTPEWDEWLNADGSPPEVTAVPPLNVSIAPALHYQSASWSPSSLDCRGMTFPLYDWVWEGQDFTDGSADRHDGHARVPWEARQPMLVFRGSIKSDSIPFNSNSRLRSIRGRAAQLSAAHPDLMDIKLTDPVCADPQPPNCRDPTLGLDLYDTSPARFLSNEQQLAYKYQIDIDGHGGTFRFKHLLLSGSLVFKVDSPLTQFWMPALEPWVHYVPVSWHNFETDLVLKLQWARANDAAAKRIMLAGREFALHHLSNAAVVGYQQQALEQLAALQSPPLPRLAGAVKFCCSLINDSKEWAHWRSKCEQYSSQRCSTSATDIFAVLA